MSPLCAFTLHIGVQGFELGHLVFHITFSLWPPHPFQWLYIPTVCLWFPSLFLKKVFSPLFYRYTQLHIQTSSHNCLTNALLHVQKQTLHLSYQIPVKWCHLAEDNLCLRTITLSSLSLTLPPYPIFNQALSIPLTKYIIIHLILFPLPPPILNHHHLFPSIAANSTQWALSFHCLPIHLHTPQFGLYFYSLKILQSLRSKMNSLRWPRGPYKIWSLFISSVLFQATLAHTCSWCSDYRFLYFWHIPGSFLPEGLWLWFP